MRITENKHVYKGMKLEYFLPWPSSRVRRSIPSRRQLGRLGRLLMLGLAPALLLGALALGGETMANRQGEIGVTRLTGAALTLLLTTPR